jgi:hypothetical protein
MSDHVPGPPARPGTVTAAGVITIVFSLLTALVLAGGAVAMGLDRSIVDTMLQDSEAELRAQGVDLDAAVTLTIVLMGMLAVWALVAVVLAVFALRRSNAARILLVISAASAALLSLLTAMAILPIGVFLACVAVIVLLFVGGANPWFAGHDDHARRDPRAVPGVSGQPAGPYADTDQQPERPRQNYPGLD